jgi:hypothetical protein
VPVRASTRVGVKIGDCQLRVLFSSTVMLPVVRQPKLPTITSRSPSPSKSAARASEVRASFVASGIVR